MRPEEMGQANRDGRPDLERQLHDALLSAALARQRSDAARDALVAALARVVRLQEEIAGAFSARG